MQSKITRSGKNAISFNEGWEQVLHRLNNEPIVCIDLETSGLDWRHNHIVGWVITFSADPRDSYYLPVRHAAGSNILNWPGPKTASDWVGDLHPIEPVILNALDQPGKLIFGHNLSFDLKFMWRLGFKRHNGKFECTQNNAALLDEHAYAYSLAACCQEAKVQSKKNVEIITYLLQKFPGTNTLNAMGQLWRLAGNDLMANEYAKGDGTSTWQLREWQQVKLANEDLTTVHDIESRLLPVLVRMSCTGVKIDEDRISNIIAHINSGFIENELGFPPDFNAKAPTQVEAWLREQGITDWKFTPKSGKPQFNEAWLSTNEPGKKIITLRRHRTLKDSFMQPMLESHSWNGRVHPNYHQLREDDYGTVTGRLSCSNPNLQQASKRDPAIGRLHRSCFIPDDGMIWGSADYAQCEPVLLAYYSRAKVLMDGFWSNPPVDAHSAVTRATNRQWSKLADEEFFGKIDKTPEFKIAREIGKRINQTLITGGGKGVLISKYGINEKDVDRIWGDYFRALPEIKRLQKRAARIMRSRGFVRSLLGRKARLIDKNKDYTALNRLLQCGNADVLKLKMVQIDDYLKSEGRPIDMINNVHDSLDFQFNEENRQYYYNCLEIMQDFSPGQPIVLDVPLRVDYNEGQTWAEATFGVEGK